MPKVSVICDNYNYSDYLHDAIKSVLSQSFTDFELIVVDDGSTDSSRELISSFNDSRIIKVFKENGGQTSAFNAGFEVACGDIITFLDSDDYWYPNKLDRVVEAHKSSKIIQHLLSENGKKTYRRVRTDVDWSNVLVNFGYMYQHSPTSGLSFMREVIEPFFPLVDVEEMRGYSDGCILMLAMTKAKVLCLDDVLGFYRIHDRNLNADRTDSGTALLYVATRQRDYVNKQLLRCGLLKIPDDHGQYISHLLSLVDFGNKPVAIYGNGNSGKRVSTALRHSGNEVWGFANSKGVDAVSPVKLFKHRKEFGKIVIASSAQDEIIDILQSLNFDNRSIVSLAI